ncbi:MAG TPA: hypothetical protein VEK13_01035 [Thermoplasmata archaeon]|nr:hypothetical protein [Thermoplasmata archaeon]
MPGRRPEPSARILRVFRREGSRRRSSPTGEVGRIYRGTGFEVVWVYKLGEEVDSHWFSQPMVDVLVVLQGRLRVEFARHRSPQVLGPGDVLVLPPGTKCRAYRWPRSSRRATIFVAIYPVGAGRERERPRDRVPRSSA